MELKVLESVQLFANLSIIFGIIFSFLQIRKISKSIDIGQQANFINVLNFFCSEYDSIICESPRCRTQKKIDLWYFRFWNLLTKEFLFFKRGLLDDYIFEFWCFKICSEYNTKPKHVPLKKIDTFKKSHLKYLQNQNGSHLNTQDYFRELIDISETAASEEEMKAMVHKLVKKYKKLK